MHHYEEHFNPEDVCMTMPHLMNCGHSEDGWCLDCVKQLHEEKERISNENELLHNTNLTGWMKRIHVWAESKGWNENIENRSEGDWAALAHSEITEAFEEHRNGKPLVYEVEGKPEGSAIEYIDAIIRILHWFSIKEVDPGWAIAKKMGYNETRSYRHGGKVT